MENKNGQGIFYGVIGVATLVVAIIGATFAYFSASTSDGGSNLTGQTLGGSGSVLSLTVQKMTFTSPAAASPDLVPANLTATKIAGADFLDTKCEATNGVDNSVKYTGCHMFKIVASAGGQTAGVALNLTAFTAPGEDKADWNYAIFSSSDAAGTADANGGAGDATIGTATPAVGAILANGSLDSTKVEVFTNQTFTAGMTKVYYMFVWLNEDNNAATQNATGANNSTGTYSGTLTLSAGANGNITASFSD